VVSSDTQAEPGAASWSALAEAFFGVASPQAAGFSIFPVVITALDPVSKRNVESELLVLMQVDP
jgi:hypothetical protein